VFQTGEEEPMKCGLESSVEEAEEAGRVAVEGALRAAVVSSRSSKMEMVLETSIIIFLVLLSTVAVFRTWPLKGVHRLIQEVKKRKDG
jgi:hypothetical protein